MAQILGSWDNLKRVLFLKIAKERIFFFFSPEADESKGSRR